MIKRVMCFFLSFALITLSFASSSSEIAYFVVDYTSGNVVSNYDAPVIYYVYDFLGVLIFVVLVFFLFKMKIISKLFSRKSLKVEKRKVIKKSSRKRK